MLLLHSHTALERVHTQQAHSASAFCGCGFKKASIVPCVFFPAAFSSAAAVFSFAASAAAVTRSVDTLLMPLWM